MIGFVDCSFGSNAKIVNTMPTNFKATNQLHVTNERERERERKIQHRMKIMERSDPFELRIKLTRIINTSMFCSANRRAIHDRIPWLNGNTKYGFMVDFAPDDFSQRSGRNTSGESKCLANRHEMKFCVTISDWKNWKSTKQGYFRLLNM